MIQYFSFEALVYSVLIDAGLETCEIYNIEAVKPMLVANLKNSYGNLYSLEMMVSSRMGFCRINLRKFVSGR